jgi:hypothetical protein
MSRGRMRGRMGEGENGRMGEKVGLWLRQWWYFMVG